MSNPTRHDEARAGGASRRAAGDRTPPRTSAMLQESPNPEMFSTTSTRPDLSVRSLREHKRALGYLAAVIVAVLVVVGAVFAFSGGGEDGPAPQAATEASATPPSSPALDRSKEVPGAMIEYQPDLPDGMSTPAQTIQSMVRNFYSLRNTAGVMPYFAPGSSFTEEFVAGNVKNVQVGTRVTGLWMFPADDGKLKNKKPLGKDPQMWLATATFALPDGKVYVESMIFMTVKVGDDYKIQEMSTLS